MSQSVGLTRNYNTGKVLSSFPLSVVLRHPVFPTISPGFSEFCAILKQGRGLNVPLFLSLSGADLLLWTIPSPTPPPSAAGPNPGPGLTMPPNQIPSE